MLKLITESELVPQYRRACEYLKQQLGADNIGDYLEFGVCHGTSMKCMHQVLDDMNLSNTRMFGFDSFEGLPESAKIDDEGAWHPGQFQADYQQTCDYLSANNIDWQKTLLVKGWFCDTLNKELLLEHRINKASLIMIDCDMYLSAKEALDFCSSLILDQSIIFFDDWNAINLASRNLGEKRAFDEFLQENPGLDAQEFGNYHYEAYPHGKVFLVTKNTA